MLILSNENIVAYLKERYPAFDLSGSVKVCDLSDPEINDVGQGLINYIYRVSNGARSLILKQGREDMKCAEGHKLPTTRNRNEYDSMRLRYAMVPQYVPKTYYADLENNVFLMEDVAYLKPSRDEFCKGVMYPDFARQCAEFIATTVFYTSEFYLDTHLFRQLSAHFVNSEMRQIMENWIFLRRSPFPGRPETAGLRSLVDGDRELDAQVHLLRHQFMSCTEAMIHADLHTSNIFVDRDQIKVLDMEYTFAGPCCYDVGYLMNNFITQYVSACFRPFPSEGARREFKLYNLRMVCELYTWYTRYFSQFWDRDAKEIYRSSPAFKELLMGRFLPDILGFASLPNLSQALGSLYLPEIGMIEDPEDLRRAVELCVILSRHFILRRGEYHDVGRVVQDIVDIERVYRAHL